VTYPGPPSPLPKNKSPNKTPHKVPSADEA
jgi:hypothetical protein